MTSFAAIVLSVLLAATTGPSTLFAASGDEQAVRKVIDDFNRARRAKDVKGFVSLYTATAEVVSPEGEVMRGAAAIQKNFERVFANLTSAGDYDRVVKTVDFVRPDVAVVRTLTDPPGPRTVLDVFVMTKEGSQWKIASRHGALVSPPALPAK
jgi:uncharacterized protein (TIGR02246 family)